MLAEVLFAKTVPSGLSGIIRQKDPAPISGEPFSEPERAQAQNRDAEDKKGEYIRPKSLNTDSLEEYSPHDDQKVSQGANVGNILKEQGHTFYGEGKPRQEDGRHEKEEGCHEGLLLCLGNRGDKKADTKNRQEINTRRNEKKTDTTFDWDTKPESAHHGNERHIEIADSSDGNGFAQHQF